MLSSETASASSKKHEMSLILFEERFPPISVGSRMSFDSGKHINLLFPQKKTEPEHFSKAREKSRPQHTFVKFLELFTFLGTN